MRRMVLGPSMYRAERNRRITEDDYDQLIERDTTGVLADGTVKFLFLHNAIPRRTTDGLFHALRRLEYNPAGSSRRAAVKSNVGGDLVFGWMDYKPGGPVQPAPMRWYPLAYHFWLVPMLNAMSNLIAQHLPAQWQAQMQAARQNGHMTVSAEWMNPNSISFHRPNILSGEPVCQLLPPIFSTITVNEDIACRAHTDRGNVAGLSCLTAVGQWEGAELCFPRFAVAFPMKPGDVLIADTRSELHGNIEPFMGRRISVVAYLQQLTVSVPPSIKVAET